MLNSIGSLSIAAGALYVRKHFQEDAKRTALEMVNGIRKEFENILREVTWMDEQTRQAALDKVHAMATHIGYPDEIMDNKKIENYYEKLEIDPDNYLLSVLNMNVFGTDYAFNKLRKPANKTDWVTHARPAIVNAFYSSIENSIREYFLCRTKSNREIGKWKLWQCDSIDVAMTQHIKISSFPL